MFFNLRSIPFATILFFVAVTSVFGAPSSSPIQVQKELHYKAICFANTRNAMAIERLIRAKYKPWTEKEKSLVIRALAKIDSFNSGILSKACNGTSLTLYRASTIGSKDSTNKKQRVMQTLASSVPGAIVLSDLVFCGSIDSVTGGLTHEVVHLADIGGQLAFSKDWIEFVKRNRTRPSLYEQSLEETLAHAVQLHVQYKRDDTLNRVIMPLLATDQNKPYRSTYSTALLLFREGSYSKSAHEFRSAAKLSDTVLAHHYLSLALYKNSELSEAFNECKKTHDLLNTLGVTFPERIRLYNLRLTASILVELGEYEKASELVRTIQSIFPTDSSVSVLTNTIKRKVGRAAGSRDFEE